MKAFTGVWALVLDSPVCIPIINQEIDMAKVCRFFHPMVGNMVKRRHWILNSGGLRSLIATALAVHENDRSRVELVHIQDGRPTAKQRLQHVQRQARHFQLAPPQVLNMSHLFAGLAADDGQPYLGALHRPQMFLAAAQLACRHTVATLTWPGSMREDVDCAAIATEQMVICDHLGQLESLEMPRFDAPLLEMSDAQILELGLHLNVPWELAWSCLRNRDTPCNNCEGCRRRREAFESLSVTAR